MTNKKREYLPANIRAGYTVAEAAEIAQESGNKGAFYVRVVSYDHGRDVNGNRTSHYSCLLLRGSPTHPDDVQHVLVSIVESGKRREQVGYSGVNEAALYALEKLGYDVDTSGKTPDDYAGCAVYPLRNFPPVEQTS